MNCAATFSMCPGARRLRFPAVIVISAWALCASALAANEGGPRSRILMFSQSALFEHTVIARHGDELSFAEKAFMEIARGINCEVECTKDGRIFDGDLHKYSAVVSYSCGRTSDLMKPARAGVNDGGPPLTAEGAMKLDVAVRKGLAFVGIHPGIWLLPEASGADCLGHGSQQVARITVASPGFPGAETLGGSFEMNEEWFSLVRFARDLHVVLVQDCFAMRTDAAADRRCYARPPFPVTWARMHDRGRVFYTSMGHREDVWESEIFRKILAGGLKWALGRVDVDITPNIDRVAPHAGASDDK